MGIGYSKLLRRVMEGDVEASLKWLQIHSPQWSATVKFIISLNPTRMDKPIKGDD